MSDLTINKPALDSPAVTNSAAFNLMYQGTVVTKVQRGNYIYKIQHHNHGRAPLFDLLLAALQGETPKGAPNALKLYTADTSCPEYPSSLNWDQLREEAQLRPISGLIHPISAPVRNGNSIKLEFKVPYQALTEQAPIYALGLFSGSSMTSSAADSAALAYYLYTDGQDAWQPVSLQSTAATASQYSLLIEWSLGFTNPGNT